MTISHKGIKKPGKFSRLSKKIRIVYVQCIWYVEDGAIFRLEDVLENHCKSFVLPGFDVIFSETFPNLPHKLQRLFLLLFRGS